MSKHPKFIKVAGKLYQRTAENPDPWQSKKIKRSPMTPEQQKQLEKEQKPKKWKALLLKMLNFPPEKIEKMTGVTAAVVARRSARRRWAETDPVADWMSKNLDSYREKGDLEGFLKDLAAKFGKDVAEEAKALMEQAKSASARTAAKRYYTDSGEFVVYHKDGAGRPDMHEGGPWFFEPKKWGEGEVYSEGYATPEEALEAAEEWEEQEDEDQRYYASRRRSVRRRRR